MKKLLVIEVNEYNSSLNTEGFVKTLLNENNISYTELFTDESIEERAEKRVADIPSEHYAAIVKEAIIQAATEQDLISKAREKECLVTGDNIYTNLKVIDSYGDIGEITKYDNELHNVLVKFFDGGSGLYCLNDKCEQDGHVETQLKLYDINKLLNLFTNQKQP